MIKTDILVRFAETDAMGIVHHSTYLVYFEAGRVALSKAHNAPYKELEDVGLALAVVEANLRYARPARFDEHIQVWTWVEKVRSRGVSFGYRITDEAGDTLVTGTTRHVCVDGQGRPARIPAHWLTALEDAVRTKP
jgi:acyl-CoA thioester hydrolase